MLSPFYTPLYSHSPAPFARPSIIFCNSQSAHLIRFKGSRNGNKIILQWTVQDNETANQFEVQKSMDGKNFVMAALVFGTDKPATDNYEFYEKAVSEKILYRIKLIGKNSKTEYSPIILIDPSK